MKNRVKQLLFFLVNPLFELFFKIALNQNKSSKIWVVDIDNTIADTINSYHCKNSSNSKRLRKLAVLRGSHKLISELSDTTVIYLTARNYIYYYPTINWLRKHNFLKNIFNLILVLNPQQKISYLKKIAYKYEVTYIDDLSFSQESGKIEFYSDVIEEIKKLPIVYYDYEYIKTLNSNNNA